METLYTVQMNIVMLLPLITVIFIILLMILSMLGKKRQINYQEKLVINNTLTDQINIKRKQLDELNERIENKTINNKVSLTNIEIKVLDWYEASNIKIPVDIIEDLSNMKLDTEENIMNYIEIQRYFWKLENSKKVFKGVNNK